MCLSRDAGIGYCSNRFFVKALNKMYKKLTVLKNAWPSSKSSIHGTSQTDKFPINISRGLLKIMNRRAGDVGGKIIFHPLIQG